jgi:exocyst complex component 4
MSGEWRPRPIGPLLTLKLFYVRFLFCGLGSLADQIMVSTGRHVRFATQFGVYKIQRNILAIQQTLRNITDGAEDAILSRAQRYWQLYEIGPKVSSRVG